MSEPEPIHHHLTADEMREPSFATRPPPWTEPADLVRSPDEAVGLEPDQVSLDAELPANTALLCVSRMTWQGVPCFGLHLYYRGPVRSATHRRDLEEQRVPDLKLADLATNAGQRAPREKPWRHAYHEVMSWWSTKRTLVKWMGELLSADDDPQLIIWDNTDYEIPWELFYHEAQEGQGSWLGARIPVLRWTRIHDSRDPWHYSARKHRCTGGLLMLEEPELAVTPDTYGPYEIEQRARSMDQLMQRLDVDDKPFGLLVIRCHGEYATDIRKYTLGGLSLNAYAEFAMPALRATRALVILNACVAGRPVTDERHPGASTRSFAEIFLRRGASGVIATVGDIDLQHSHDFAVRMIENADGRDLNLAAQIRAHRAYYADKVRRRSGVADGRTEEDFRRFFSSFMYVYFGHPATVLRIDATPHEVDHEPA